MASLYKSITGKKEIWDLYDKKLKDLHISHESIYVDTTYGNTHVIKTGDANKPPLILVHGSNGCAPVALDCYHHLTEKYEVYAVDVLAQPNKSAETRMSMKDDSYGRWMQEVMDGLEIEDVVLAGFSFGGLVILKTLAYSGVKVKEAFVASPAYIVNGNPLIALWKIFIPMKRYMKTLDVKYIEDFLSVIFTEREEFAVNFLARVFAHFEMDFTPMPVINKKEAALIQTPFTILAAGNDILFPGKKMQKRASKIFPTMKQFLLLDNSKHVQDQAGNALFEKLILGKS